MVAASRAVAEYRTSGGFNPALVRFRRTVGRAAAKTTLVPNRPTLFTNATSDLAAVVSISGTSLKSSINSITASAGHAVCDHS